MTSLRILFLSDLHAIGTVREEGSPSWVDATQAVRQPTSDGFEALKQLISDTKLRVDLVVCGGDLGDKADSAGIAHAWKELHDIGQRVGATHTVAVCGNHDLDSRFIANTNDPDPKGVLQQLHPAFPAINDTICDRFWSRNFVTFDLLGNGCRLLLLNSSAYHGGPETEIEHGRITLRTIDRIKQTITSEGSREINILVSHHHPYPYAQLSGEPDQQAMVNGKALLEVIGDPTSGPWLLLHGHRHQPCITLASSGITPPIVIGAAAFSRRLSEVANQVHLIEVEKCEELEYDLRGSVTSWTFTYGTGFVLLPTSTNGLPGKCAFGYRGNALVLIDRIAAYIQANPAAYVEWREIQAHFTQVKYLMPDAMKFCIDRLRSKGIAIHLEADGTPAQARVHHD